MYYWSVMEHVVKFKIDLLLKNVLKLRFSFLCVKLWLSDFTLGDRANGSKGTHITTSGTSSKCSGGTKVSILTALILPARPKVIKFQTM